MYNTVAHWFAASKYILLLNAGQLYIATQLSNSITVGEGKTSQSLGDQIIASGGIVLSEFPTDVRVNHLIHIIMYIFNICE